MDFSVRLNTERATVLYRAGVELGQFQPIDPRIARVVIFGMCFALTRWPQLREEFSQPAISAQIWKVASEGLLRSDH